MQKSASAHTPAHNTCRRRPRPLVCRPRPTSFTTHGVTVCTPWHAQSTSSAHVHATCSRTCAATRGRVRVPAAFLGTPHLVNVAGCRGDDVVAGGCSTGRCRMLAPPATKNAAQIRAERFHLLSHTRMSLSRDGGRDCGRTVVKRAHDQRPSDHSPQKLQNKTVGRVDSCDARRARGSVHSQDTHACSSAHVPPRPLGPSPTRTPPS